MAAKYMGAKMLKKQIEKAQAKAAAKSIMTKGAKMANNNEGLDRKKQKFDFTANAMSVEKMFAEEAEVDKHPQFNQAHEYL